MNYLKQNNNKITDSDLIAEYMNEFLTNVGADLSNKIIPPQNKSIQLN